MIRTTILVSDKTETILVSKGKVLGGIALSTSDRVTKIFDFIQYESALVQALLMEK